MAVMNTCAYQFACDNGRCVSSSLYCDFRDDCGDNSDERSCVFPPCSIDEFRCQNGKCILSKYVCDLFNDCQDWSDERSCEGLCQQFQCYDGTCLPMHWVKDGMVDCPGVNKEDELGAKRHHICDFKRSSPIYWWFTADDSRKYCKRVPDGFGKYLSAPSTIEPCDERECLVDEFQCGDGACIFAENVCDGTRDCKEGEDEHVCDAYSCPFFFRCSQSQVCLSPDKICDGNFQCPLGDDERYCHMTCPSKAECKGTSVKLNDFNMTSLHNHTRELDMTGVYIPQLTDFPTMPFLMRLCLSQCGLIVIPDVFSTLTNLLYLDVSHNILASLPGRVFRSLEQLIELNISGNTFDRINPEGFKGLGRLVSLDISECRIAKLTHKTLKYTKALRKLFLRDNVIDFIENNAFAGLTYLMDLDLSGNPVVQFSEQVFSGLNSLTYLSTDNYLLCCSKVRPSTIEDNKCEAPVNSLSSCKDLMHRDILRAFLWILGILALLGNVCVIIYRIVVNRRSTTNGCDFFVVNLGFSDLLMGMYMMIIAGADVRYRGVYVWNDYEWRNSALCKVAGVLATLSSEASVVFVCLITLDRFLVIKFPFRQVRLNRICIWILVVGTWVLAIFLSVIPLFPSLRGWNFYGRNGACLALPLSKERLAGWEYSVSIFIAVNFVIFVLIAIGQWTVYSSIKEGSFLKGKERRQQDLRIAKKLFFVAMTDFMCWFPVCIMGIVALSGTSIQGEVYAWTAVFILPINSALNPILYTLPSITRQRAAGTMKTGSRPRAVVYDVNTRTSISDATEMTSESRNL
ncbi:G-protein coupled receptor GRL101-like [Haliotis rufescens]|uniref:G-protein coupled receptor GRL101-like n=1 Tax=Haliotis rufescens TaxID=6454 RepID=UPI00201EFF4A|nr:G-protein coupled receptor GRL101-like [Haliotis rufescens]